MRKFLAATAIALCLAGHADAQSGGNGKPNSSYPSPLGYCQFTVTSSAQSLAQLSCTVPARAAYAAIAVETVGARMRDDGTAPTASVGFPLTPTSSTVPFYMGYQSNFSAMQFIAQSGSPVVDILFYDSIPGPP